MGDLFHKQKDIQEKIALLPSDQSKALKFILDKCGFKEPPLHSELPLDHDYFEWMNAFRGKFNNPNPVVEEEVVAPKKTKK